MPLALNVADWLIIIIIAVSTLLSLWRGFVREALSLVSWVFALVLSLVFSDRLAFLLSGQIADPTAAYLVAFAILFLSTLVIGALVGRLMRGIVAMAGLGLLDRVLGTVFGAARGVLLLLALAVLLRPALGLDQTDWWRDSLLLPHLMLLESWFHAAAESLRELIAQFWA